MVLGAVTVWVGVAVWVVGKRGNAKGLKENGWYSGIATGDAEVIAGVAVIKRARPNWAVDVARGRLGGEQALRVIAAREGDLCRVCPLP